MIDLSTLDPEIGKRLRRLHHLTSVTTAVRIVQSGCIWSNDVDGAANFSMNQVPNDCLDETPEISLQFEFTGTAILVPFDFPNTQYLADVLYIHVTDGLAAPSLDTIKIWAARWPRGSKANMRCVQFAQIKDFVNASRADPYLQLTLGRLVELLQHPKEMRVPLGSDVYELKKQYPPPKFGKFEELKQRYFGKHPMSPTDRS
jgi:hypothetical protein